MPEHIPYLIQRNGVFHYRRHVPADVRNAVGLSYWKQSLGTSDRDAAKSKIERLARLHDEQIDRARRIPTAERYRELSAQQNALLDEADAAFRAGDMKLARRRWSEALRLSDRANGAYVDAIMDSATLAKDKFATLSLTDRAAIEKLGGLKKLYSALVDDHFELATLSLLLRLADHLGTDWLPHDIPNETGDATFNVPALPAGSTREDYDDHIALIEKRADRRWGALRKVGIDKSVQGNDPNNPRLSGILPQWFDERKQQVQAQRRHRVAINRFIELHGDLPVKRVTREHVTAYVKAIENLADKRRVPVAQRASLSDPGADVPRVSAATVGRHLASIKAALGFCLEKGWCPQNVATGVRAPKDTRPKAGKRRPFTLEERRKVLAQAVEEGGENSDMAWLIRLGAYTGARIEELAQLPRTHAREIEGIACIEIDDLDGRAVKNVGSVRAIPLHPAIRDDFVAWAHSCKGDRVFASFRADKDGRFANEVSGDFGRLMDRAGLPDPRLTFHSLRHTLKRAMTDARLDPEVRRAVLGHAPKDAHDSYGGGVSLSTVEAELERLPLMF